MGKKNIPPSESENEPLATNSEDSAEYIKYIKNLGLQRSVLNKILNSDITQITKDTSIDPENFDSN